MLGAGLKAEGTLDCTKPAKPMGDELLTVLDLQKPVFDKVRFSVYDCGTSLYLGDPLADRVRAQTSFLNRCQLWVI